MVNPDGTAAAEGGPGRFVVAYEHAPEADPAGRSDDGNAVKMNARSQVFGLNVEFRQLVEAVETIFHTVLFQRSSGKFRYQDETTYFIEAQGFKDVDCDYIDHTYVRSDSQQLQVKLNEEISAFSNELERIHASDPTAPIKGQVSLEFYQRRRRYPFNMGYESIPWEVWTIRIEVVQNLTESERLKLKDKLAEQLREKVLYICQVANRRDYVPKTPNKPDLDLVYDCSYPDVQPYLFKISYVTSSGPNYSVASVGSSVKNFFKDTLQIE